MLLHGSAHFMNLLQLPSSLKSMGKRLRSVTGYTTRLSHTKQHCNMNNIARNWAILTMTLVNLTNFAHGEMRSLPVLEEYSMKTMDGQRRHSVSSVAHHLQTLETLTRRYQVTIG